MGNSDVVERALIDGGFAHEVNIGSADIPCYVEYDGRRGDDESVWLINVYLWVSETDRSGFPIAGAPRSHDVWEALTSEEKDKIYMLVHEHGMANRG